MSAYPWLVYLHILAAITWVGGLVYLGAVVVPATRHLGLDERQRQRVFAELGRRMRVLGWGALGVLVLTGAAMLALRGVALADLWSGAGRFMVLLRTKLALVAALVAVLLVHDALGVAASRAAPGSAEAARLRRRASWLGRMATVLSLAVVYYAVRLVRG